MWSPSLWHYITYVRSAKISLASLWIFAVGSTMSPTPAGGWSLNTSWYAILSTWLGGFTTPCLSTIKHELFVGAWGGGLLVTLLGLFCILHVWDFSPGSYLMWVKNTTLVWPFELFNYHRMSHCSSLRLSEYPACTVCVAKQQWDTSLKDKGRPSHLCLPCAGLQCRVILFGTHSRDAESCSS